MRVLIPGGSGVVGRRLAAKLAADGYEVVLRPEGDGPGDDFAAQVCVKWKEAARWNRSGVRRAVIRTRVVLSPEALALRRLILPYSAGALARRVRSFAQAVSPSLSEYAGNGCIPALQSASNSCGSCEGRWYRKAAGVNRCRRLVGENFC